MLIVSGMHRETGHVRTDKFHPGREGDARKFRGHLRALGYDTVFINEVKERYRAAANRYGKDWKCKCDACVTTSQERGQPFAFAGVVAYQLHGNGTGSGSMKGQHIKDSGTAFLEDAIEQAEKLVDKWRDTHKGIVIYKAIKLVRKVTKPTTEIVELS